MVALSTSSSSMIAGKTKSFQSDRVKSQKHCTSIVGVPLLLPSSGFNVLARPAASGLYQRIPVAGSQKCSTMPLEGSAIGNSSCANHAAMTSTRSLTGLMRRIVKVGNATGPLKKLDGTGSKPEGMGPLTEVQILGLVPNPQWCLRVMAEVAWASEPGAWHRDAGSKLEIRGLRACGLRADVLQCRVDGPSHLR
jgi:hypothetical protein